MDENVAAFIKVVALFKAVVPLTIGLLYTKTLLLVFILIAAAILELCNIKFVFVNVSENHISC